LFAALTLAVTCRLAFPLVSALYLPLMAAAALAWAIAFAGFDLAYAALLLSRGPSKLPAFLACRAADAYRRSLRGIPGGAN
jgi:uncharacterized protein involved in response to NO